MWMNEMSTPTVYLEAQVLKCARILKDNGRYVPDISMAGGFINETQIFKSITMSNFGDGPFVKAITMARGPLAAAMKADYFVELARQNKLPKDFADTYGTDPLQFFIAVPQLKEQYGEQFEQIPFSAIGLYTYLRERIGVGLQQLMAGVRKWKLSLISRDDLAALDERAAAVTGIPTLEKIESDVLEEILLE